MEPPSPPASAKELARFFGYSHDLLVVLDSRWRVRAASPSVERVLGVSPSAVVGTRLVKWVPREERRGAVARARPLLRGRLVGALDVDMTSARGGTVPVRWSLSTDEEGRIYAVGRDRTSELSHIEDRLRSEATELRLRTAMELHDGILQTLTAASLQIAVARRLLQADPGRAESALAILADSVEAEQQEMRLHVDELKNEAAGTRPSATRFPERIESMVRRVAAMWSLSTSLETEVARPLGGELERQLVRLVQEAMVNAARHGGATTLSVSVLMEESSVVVSVTDNGRGFSFRGVYDHDALREKRLGPVSLKHRVQETGGRMSIDSSRGCSTVTIRIPIPSEEPHP